MPLEDRSASELEIQQSISQPPRSLEYQEIALENQGDAANGKELFHNAKRTTCLQCHTVDGKASKSGPDLLGIADKYPRRDLIRSILEPSATILPGYSTTVVMTKSGNVYQGILKQVSETEIELWTTGDGPIRIATKDIEMKKTSEVSLMPEGVHKTLTPQDFADLIAYLEILKQPAVADSVSAGTPDVIPRLEKPIHPRPFHAPDLRFDHPVWFGPLPGFEDVYVVLEHQQAKIWLLEKHPAGDRKTMFADFGPEVSDGPFEGLMCMAFHPRFRENRKYYLKHEVVENNQRSTIVVEKQAAADYKADSGIPSRRLLKIDQPAENHNGGTIAFGPDGYMYIGMGDGGPQEDPLGHSQDPRSFLGKMLRIDVDSTEADKPYAIPPFNSLSREADPESRPEIWAFGFREPWRFSFDRETGELWLGDVGQGRFEEVAMVRAGENHGWNVYEGFEPFSSRYRKEGVVHVPPVVALERKHGVSVTGGYVYRGRRNSSFEGVYLFGDFESRRIWGLTHENRKLTKIREIGTSPAKIASFGQDQNGELYLVGYDDGIIYQLDLETGIFK